jgi:hypothetical protein
VATCSKIGCPSAGAWRPVLVVPPRATGMALELPIVVCAEHRDSRLARRLAQELRPRVNVIAARQGVSPPDWLRARLTFEPVS